MGYETVTEIPGNKASKENIDMLYSRYKWASQFVKDKGVLEVGCGAGLGLGYLAKKARRVVGGDIDETILEKAKEHYQGKVELLQFDAQALPFEDNSFDLIILFEAIYYLKEPDKFLQECQRVLRKAGKVLVSLPNKEWSGFNPSPLSQKYFSASELKDLFLKNNFRPKIFGAFKEKGEVLSFVREKAVRLHLIPKTMKGKEKLKRLFFGKLLTIPAQIKEGMAEYYQPLAIDFDSLNKYKILYILAEKC